MGFPGSTSGKEHACRCRRFKEMWVQSLGWEDPLEEGTATHSSILAWRIPWIEEAGRLQSMESQRVGHDWVTSTCHHWAMRKVPRSPFSSRAPWYMRVQMGGWYFSAGDSKSTSVIHLLLLWNDENLCINLFYQSLLRTQMLNFMAFRLNQYTWKDPIILFLA